MMSHDMIRVMQAEREREVQEHLRVRRLLGVRRPFIRWRPQGGRGQDQLGGRR